MYASSSQTFSSTHFAFDFDPLILSYWCNSRTLILLILFFLSGFIVRTLLVLGKSLILLAIVATHITNFSHLLTISVIEAT
jgi:hypothetical protein